MDKDRIKGKMNEPPLHIGQDNQFDTWFSLLWLAHSPNYLMLRRRIHRSKCEIHLCSGIELS